MVVNIWLTSKFTMTMLVTNQLKKINQFFSRLGSGGGEFGFHSVEIQFTYCLNLQGGLDFFDFWLNFDALIKCLVVHAQLTITLLHILFANVLSWYQLETYIEDPLEKWSHKMTWRIWSRDSSWKFL